MPSGGASFIYAIGCPSPPAIKFGHSRNVLGRFSSIQVSSPVGLDLLGYREFDCAKAVEGQIHFVLSSFRLRGEWFKRCPVTLSVVRGLLELPQAEFLKKLDGLAEREMERSRLAAHSGYAHAPFGGDKVDLHIVRKV